MTIPPVEDIMPLLNFDAVDLHSNRNGTFSDNQQQRLRSRQTRTIIIGGLGFIGLALLATTFLYFGEESGILALLGIFTTIINAIFLGMIARQWMQLRADLTQDTVERISGELERVIKANRRVGNYILRVQGEDFVVSKDIFLVFEHEADYNFYRTPHAQILLSAEPM